MRILDDDGKLFGIINLFDLIALLIIAGSAFFAYKWATVSEDPSWAKVDYRDRYCIASIDVAEFMVEAIKEGDEMLNLEGKVVGHIEKILEVQESRGTVLTSKTGEKISFSSESKRIIAMLKVLTYTLRGETYLYSTSNLLKIGSALEVSTKKYTLNGVIQKII